MEACAGDGRLTKALQQRGIAVTAVDDRSRGTGNQRSLQRPPRNPSGRLADRHPVNKSQGPDIVYPDWVIKGDAVEHVTQHQPDVVIASWVECRDDLDQRLAEWARHVGKVVRVIGGGPFRPEVAPPTPWQARRAGRASDRAVRPVRPGNAGGGKGPDFWCAFEGAKDR